VHVCVVGLRGIPHVIGGIEAHCQKLYPELRRQAPDVRVTVLIRHGYTEAEVFEYEGLAVKTIWSPRIWGVDTLIHSFLSVLYAGLWVRPDILHLHGIGPAFFTPLGRLLGLRAVVTHHAQDYLRPKWSGKARAFLRWGERSAARSANAIICVSVALFDRFTTLYPRAKSRSCVIRNANTIEDLGLPNASPILEDLGVEPGGYVLAVGRLEATKAFDDLVAAFRRAEHDELKLVIVGSDIGDEDYARELRSHAGPNIIFAGFQSGDALRRLYEEASLFVHPSHMEGYGLVVAEALAADLPLLLSDIPPHREFGLPEPCYFEVGNVEALAAKLRQFSFDAYIAEDASAAQRRNGWAAAARRHLELYRTVARKPWRRDAARPGADSDVSMPPMRQDVLAAPSKAAQ